MKQINRMLTTLTLVVFSNLAQAEWVEIEKFEDGTRVFVDKSSAHRTGDRARLEHLVRWAEPQVDPEQPPYWSTKVRTDYDCEGKREKYISSISYSGTMGNGPRVAIDDREAERWDSISESSMEEKLWRIACNAE